MLIPPNTPWKGLLPHLEAEHNSADLWCSLMRFTFCVPWRTCKHPARSYQVIDANVAGCRDCGTVHVCVRCNCTCPVCISEEGQEVCTLTGYCLPMVIYSPMEKPDTMFFVEGGQAAQASGSQGRDSEDSRPAVVTPTGKMFRVGADGRKDDVNGTVRFDPSAKKHFSIHRMPGWSSTGAPALIPMPSSYNSTAGCSLLDDSIAPGSGSQLEAPGSGGRKAPHQTAASSSRGGGGGCRVTKSKAKGDVNLNCTVVEDVHHQVLSALNKVLCDRGRLSGSIKWTCVMRDERRKTISKRKDMAVRWMKSRRMKGHASVNIMECMSSIMHDTRDLRIPVLLDEKSRQRVSNDCSECISSMILMLNQLRPGCVPEHKIQQVSVGLLYLMRVGVVVHDVSALPVMPALNSILPQEIHLESMTGIKNKCITESENLCNEVLRSASLDALSKCMMAEVCTRLPDV